MIVRTAALVLVLVCGLAVQAFPQVQPPPTPQPPSQPAPPQPPQLPAPQATPAPPPTMIIPGASIGGIQLGASVRALQARLGLPSEVVERAGFAVHLYGRVGLVVYVRQNAVAAVATTNSVFRVGRTLGVGDRAADARAEFGAASGQGTLTGFRADLYDDRGIGFGFDRDTIATIIVFRPGEARLFSTL